MQRCTPFRLLAALVLAAAIPAAGCESLNEGSTQSTDQGSTGGSTIAAIRDRAGGDRGYWAHGAAYDATN